MDPESRKSPDGLPSAPTVPRAAAGRTPWGRFVGLAALLAILLGAALAAQPAYRRIVQWRARTVVAQADELIRQQLFPEAVAKLETALRVDPTCAPALRAMADIYTRFELPAALPRLQALVNSPDRTDDDVRNFIEVALKVQRFDLAESELARLLGRPDISNLTRILATEFFFRLGDMPRALKFADDIRRLDPTNNSHHLRAAKILLNTPEPARQQEGLRLLTSLNHLSPVDRINIAEILSSAPSLPTAEVQEVLRLVPVERGANILEYLLRCNVLLRLQPGNRDGIVNSAVSQYRNGTPQEQADLTTWLMRQGAHEWVLKSYSVTEAARNVPVLTNYLEALARAGKWNDLGLAVQNPQPVDPWIQEGFRAVAAGRLGQDALAQEHWRRAFESTAAAPAKLRILGDFAYRLGFAPVAIMAYEQLLGVPLYRGSALRRLAQLHERERNTDALRSVMQTWSANGDHPYAENAYCYLSALTNRDVDNAYPRAEKLCRSMPARIQFRATLAFLEWRRGNAAAALQHLDRAALDLPNETPQTRLVYAALLDANGRQTDARRAVANLKPDRLLLEEQALLRRILGN